MDVLASHMNQRSFHGIFTGTTPGVMNRLRIPVNTINNGLLLDGITHVEANKVTVHSKLRFLKEFLTSPNLKIPEAFGPPWRYSFHQYLGLDYEIESDYCLVFVKLFVPQLQSMRGIGKFYLDKNKIIGDVDDGLVELVELKDGTNIDIYEEITPDKIMKIDKKSFIDDTELQNGDILCIQEQLSEKQ